MSKLKSFNTVSAESFLSGTLCGVLQVLAGANLPEDHIVSELVKWQTNVMTNIHRGNLRPDYDAYDMIMEAVSLMREQGGTFQADRIQNAFHKAIMKPFLE